MMNDTGESVGSLAANLSVNDDTIYITDPEVISKVNDKFVNSIYLPSLIYTIILLLIGSPGNALVIYVYYKWRRSTSRLFIMTLAAYDFLNCTLTMPTEIYFLFNIIQTEYPWLCKISRFVTFTMNNGSSVVLLAISIDRFFRIYKPLVPPMRKRTAEIVIAVSFVFAVASAWPALLLYGESKSMLPIKKNVKMIMKMCLIDEQYNRTIWPLVFNICTTIGTVIIDIIMICAYSYIGHQAIKAIRETHQYFPSFACSRNNSIDMSIDVSHSQGESMNGDHLEDVAGAFKSLERQCLHVQKNSIPSNELAKSDEWRKGSQCTIASETKRKKKRHTSSEKGRKQMLKSTLMLFMVTLLFILSYIPFSIIVFIRYTRPNDYVLYSTTRKAFYQLFLRSYMLSSALNPVIYSFMSDKFRNQCKRIFSDIFVKLKLLKPRDRF